MDAVAEGVVRRHRKRHCHPPALAGVFPPGDVGDRVVAVEAARLRNRREVDPRQAGEVEVVVPRLLRVEQEAVPLPRRRLAAAAQELAEVLAPLDPDALEELAVRARLGEGGVDPLVQQRPPLPDAHPEGGDPVCGADDEIPHRVVGGPAPRLHERAKAGHVEPRAEVVLRAVERTEIPVLLPPGPCLQIDPLHAVTPPLSPPGRGRGRAGGRGSFPPPRPCP